MPLTFLFLSLYWQIMPFGHITPVVTLTFTSCIDLTQCNLDLHSAVPSMLERLKVHNEMRRQILAKRKYDAGNDYKYIYYYCNNVVKVCKRYVFYKALYPVRWTAQSALHLSSPGRPVHSDTNSASLGSILAMPHLRNDYSLTRPPLSIARYSFIQLSRLRRREENENAQTSKR